jgi:hypothetical protein
MLQYLYDRAGNVRRKQEYVDGNGSSSEEYGYDSLGQLTGYRTFKPPAPFDPRAFALALVPPKGTAYGNGQKIMDGLIVPI